MDTQILNNDFSGGTQILNSEQPGGTQIIDNTPIEATQSTSNSGNGGLLAIGEEINGYKIVSKFDKDSGEAELYICTKANIEYVIKYYYECKPKYEILDKLKSYNNPDIVSLYEYGTYKDHFYTIIEYAKGGALDDKNEDGTYKYLPVSEDTAIQITKEVINAFSQIHKNGIIHRDIKPGNLFYKNEDGSDILVGDFGISSYFDVDDGMSKHMTQAKKRTEGYTAPELYSGVIGPELDYYSLGVTLWELLTAKEPFETKDGKAMYPGQIMLDTMQGKMVDNLLSRSPNLSVKMKTLIKGLMTVRHEKRWNYDLVTRFLNGEDVPVYEDVHSIPSFEVGDQVCTSYKEIAEALISNVEEAKKILYKGILNRYLVKIDQKFADKIANKIDDYSSSNDYDTGVYYVAYALCPNLGFKITDKISVESLEDINKALESNPNDMYKFLINDNLGFYTYLKVIGLGDIADKIKNIVNNTKGLHLVVPKVMVALNNNEIRPFQDGVYDNITIKNISQLSNLENDLKERLLLLIHTNNRLLCAWIENITGRNVNCWLKSYMDKDFLQRVDSYGEWTYFMAFLEKKYVPVYYKNIEDGKVGLMDIYGNKVIDAVWDDVKEICIENKFIVKKNDLWGVVYADGKNLIPFKFKNIEVFDELYELYIATDKNGSCSLINKQGNPYITGEFANYPTKNNKFYCQVINNALYSYKDGKFKKGKQFDNLYVVPKDEEYLFWGVEKNKLGLYDNKGTKQGECEVNCKIKEILYDDNGSIYFVGSENKKYGVIDSLGSKVLNFEYDEIVFEDNILFVKKDNKYGLYNLNTKSFDVSLEHETYIKEGNVIVFKNDDKYSIYKVDNDGVKYNGYIENNKVLNSEGEEIISIVNSQFFDNYEDGILDTEVEVFNEDGFFNVDLSNLFVSEADVLYYKNAVWNYIFNNYPPTEMLKLATNFRDKDHYRSLNILVCLINDNIKWEDAKYIESNKEILSMLRKNKTEGLEYGFDYYMAYLGKIYYTKQEYSESLQYYNLAISINNTEAWYYWRGFDSAYKAHKYTEALPLIEKASEMLPDDVWIMNRRGNALYSLERYQESITWYTMAIEKEEHKVFFTNRAGAYSKLAKNGAPTLEEKAKQDREYANTLSD